MASTTRILDLLSTKINITSGEKALPHKEVAGSIKFDNIEFAYNNERKVLKGISFNIPKGKTAAFVGTSGAGKTTLIKLLLRFYNPTSGNILLDGDDVSNYRMADLRRAVSLVSQDVFLFHGTIAENIAYAYPACPVEDIIEAAKKAEAHEFISNMPEGYNTIVGERGQRLSGGQRQRIAIARAILRNPPILIFDEATSAVDNETELAIQTSLEKITKNRTTILVAHRLSTIRHADCIYVLKDGLISEFGDHSALLKKKGTYADLWSLQTGETQKARKTRK